MHTVNNFITMVNLKSCRQDKKKSSHLIINNLLWRIPTFSIHACFPKCRFYCRQLFNAVKSGCKKILWFTYFHSLLFDFFFLTSKVNSETIKMHLLGPVLVELILILFPLLPQILSQMHLCIFQLLQLLQSFFWRQRCVESNRAETRINGYRI